MLLAVSVGLAKLWLTLGICLGVILLRIVVAAILRELRRGRPRNRLVFWTDQAASLAALAGIGIGSTTMEVTLMNRS